MKIDIVIPILNEEETLRAQVQKLIAFLADSTETNYTFSIIIADNGSTDGSPEIAELLQSEYPMVTYMRVDERGVGRALKYAWTRSEADVVGYMDLDLATDVKHLADAISPLASDAADIVTGTRLAKGSTVVGRSLTRAVTTRVYNWMVRTYFGTKFTDGMCGFKFLKREYLPGLMALGAKSDGWFSATELLVCAEYSGLRVLDLPVHWTDDPNSKARIGKLAVEYTAAMRKLKRNLQAAGHGTPAT